MSNVWFVTLDHFGKDEDIVTIENTKTCIQKENSHYHVIVDGGISICFDKPIKCIESEEDIDKALEKNANDINDMKL